jgi:cellulose synthase operon protein C
MVSAPSVRKARKEAASARRRQAIGAAYRRRRAPIMIVLTIVAVVVALVGGALAVRAWLTDPLQRGRAALAAQDYRAARIDFMTALEQRPRDTGARIDLARSLVGLGRHREAERQFDRAVELGADPAVVRADLAEARLGQGRADDALAALAGPVPAADRSRTYRIAAEANYQLGRIDAARAAFADAIAGAIAGEGSVDSWIAFARFRLAEQDMTGADAAANRARALAPASVVALGVKADVVRARAGPVAALPWYRAALAKEAAHVPTLVEYAAALGDAGRYRAMLIPLRRAAELDPGNPRVSFLMAVVAARGGEPALARSLLSRIDGEDAVQPAVLLVRAAVELSLDAPAAARDAAATLVQRQPDNRSARQLLALALARADNVRGAIEVIDPITIRSDADSWSLLLLSRSFSAIGWHDGAIQPLDRAARLTIGDPASLAVMRVGGDSLDPAVAVPAIRAALAGGQAASALALATRLVDANPGVPQARLLLGDAALAMGNVPAAAAHFRRASQLRFDEPTMLRLVNALARSGDRAGAGDALAAFMHRWPQNVPAMRIAAAFVAENGEWPVALAYLDAASARGGGGDALMLAQIARAHLEMDDASAALPIAARAYRLLPGNATISGLYGLALHRNGQGGEDSRDLLNKAVQLASDDGILRRWQAEVAG